MYKPIFKRLSKSSLMSSLKRLFILHNNIETKSTERKSIKNYFKPYNTVIKENFLGKVEHIRNEKKSDRYVKKPSKNKCTCFIYGDPKHLINACPNKRNDYFEERVNLIHNLEDDIISISSDDSEACSIISDYEILKLTHLNLESSSEQSIDSDDKDYSFMNIDL